MMLINPYRFTAPAPAGASDDFNRANGALGANWTVWDGIIVIESNKAKPNVLDGAAWATAMASANHFAKGTVSKDAGHSTSSRFGPAVRMSSNGGSYYVASIRPSDGRYTIDRIDAGVQTSQLTTPAGSWADGKVVELRATTNGAGVDLVMLVDNVQVATANDPTALTGLHVGFGSAAGGNNGFIDDWSGGTL